MGALRRILRLRLSGPMATFDKLSVINSCLLRTGNNPVAVEGDGSDEWLAASESWDVNFPLLVEMHNWWFADDTATLTRIGESEDPEFSDSYVIPPGCLHVKQVYVNSFPVTWKMGIDAILLSPAIAIDPVAKFIILPDPTQLTNAFVEALRCRISADLYRGLNEDQEAADKAEAKGEYWLSLARNRADQSSSARALSRSRVLEARRIRKGRW